MSARDSNSDSASADAADPLYANGQRWRLALAVCCTFVLAPSFSNAELEILGIDSALAKNVMAFVELAGEPCDAEPWRIRRRYRSVDVQARNALKPYGYYEPTVQTTLVQTDDCWQATLNIEPGPRVHYRNIDISIEGEAASDVAFSANLPKTLVAGLPLRHRDYEQYKQALQINAVDRGYVDAAFGTSRLDIWPETQTADVSMSFDSGPRYGFGDITLDQSALDPSLVLRYVDLEPGVPYDGSLVTRAFRDLSDSGYFRRVEITPEFDQAADQRIPLRVTLEPIERLEYTLGAGFATDTGPRFRAGFRNRRVNRRGHRINAGLRLSPVISGINMEYRRPLRDPRSEWMSYTGSLGREDTDTFKNDTLQLGLRRSKRFSASWIRTLSVDYNYERFTVGTVADSSRLILPSVSFDHKSADRDLYPANGRRLVLELRGASETLGSTTSFMQVLGRLRWVKSFGKHTRVLARATVGFTSKEDLQELPPSVRFFAGGDTSVRGFGYNTLGPRDVDGNVIGGSHLLVTSLEAERYLRDNFYGAVFVDAGNAFDSTAVDPAVSAGLGLIWRSPVGPVRVYLGHPFNKIDRSVRLHVSLGADL